MAKQLITSNSLDSGTCFICRAIIAVCTLDKIVSWSKITWIKLDNSSNNNNIQVFFRHKRLLLMNGGVMSLQANAQTTSCHQTVSISLQTLTSLPVCQVLGRQWQD